MSAGAATGIALVLIIVLATVFNLAIWSFIIWAAAKLGFIEAFKWTYVFGGMLLTFVIKAIK